MTRRWLTVIGIGDGGLASLGVPAREALGAASVVVGGVRHLAMLDAEPGLCSARRMPWRSPFEASVAELIALRGQDVAVLASGDPMWFGVGGTLSRHGLGAEMHVIPGASAFSLAAGRMGWPVEICDCRTVHGRPLESVLPGLRAGARLLVYAQDGGTPALLAALLGEQGYGASAMTVLEHLGGPNERVRERLAADFAMPDIAALNTIAVECRSASPVRRRTSGAVLPDEAFRHDGKMTKRVARAMALSALEPADGECLWDVGAGSGAISVEWLRGAPDGRAIAIEPLEERRASIVANAKAHGVSNLVLVEGRAPAAFAGLERPDAVFIGGGLSEGVFDAAWDALSEGGRMVAHAVTLESEAILIALHARLGGELMRIAVDQATPVGPFRGWRPSMPVIHWHVTKGVGHVKKEAAR